MVGESSKRAEADAADELRRTLERFDERLLRRVADQLLKSRLQRTRGQLIEKIAATLVNPAVVDRRLKDLTSFLQSLLGLLALGGRHSWRLGFLLECLSCLGARAGLTDIFSLLEAGMIYPVIPSQVARLASFDEWLGLAASTDYRIHIPPLVMERALHFGIKLEPLPKTTADVRDIRESDGLDLSLQLGALWQTVRATPLRLTQQGDFFKRDQERFTADTMLAGSPVDQIEPLRDAGQFLVAFGLANGVLHRDGMQLLAGTLPSQSPDLDTHVRELWTALPELNAWDAMTGWRGLDSGPHPYASAGLVSCGLLAGLPADQWVRPESIAEYLAQRHCYWRKDESASGGESEVKTRIFAPELGSTATEVELDTDASGASAPERLLRWSRAFFLGVTYTLRLVQVGKDADGQWVTRLSPFGRSVLKLTSPLPSAAFPKTLLVQPNLEIIAYRQGLTPNLIFTLSQFADWKTLGPACQLQLTPTSIYRGLESGLSMDGMLQALEQYGVRETPATVLQALRTWANKRERLSAYHSATLLEFNTAEELQIAIGRGQSGIRLNDRLLLVATEDAVDYRHFRLVGSRDYGLPPDQCVTVGADGVTLLVDVTRSDLLLETEIQRFAERLPSGGNHSSRGFQLTYASLHRGRESGLSLTFLEEWFQQRTGQPLPPSARLLMSGDAAPVMIRQLIVVEVPTPALADGLIQWPPTRSLIQSRLGPTAVAIEAHQIDRFQATLRELNYVIRTL